MKGAGRLKGWNAVVVVVIAVGREEVQASRRMRRMDSGTDCLRMDGLLLVGVDNCFHAVAAAAAVGAGAAGGDSDEGYGLELDADGGAALELDAAAPAAAPAGAVGDATLEHRVAAAAAAAAVAWQNRLLLPLHRHCSSMTSDPFFINAFE